MQLTFEQNEELLRYVSPEGDPRFYWDNSDVFNKADLPLQWAGLLNSGSSPALFVDMIWARAIPILPRTVSQLRQKVKAVGLLSTKTRRLSLIYVFTKDGELFPRRGYLPLREPFPALSRLPAKLATLCSIHDGWIDFFSGDTGVLPSQEWKTVGSSPSENDEGFLEIFVAGPNSMGFDLSSSPLQSAIIWGDDEVEPIPDFFGRLDSWITDEISEMDI